MKDFELQSNSLSSLFQTGNYVKAICDYKEKIYLNELNENDIVIFSIILQKLSRVPDAKRFFDWAFSNYRNSYKIYLHRILFLMNYEFEQVQFLLPSLKSINYIIESHPNYKLAYAIKARLLALKYYQRIFNLNKDSKLCEIDVSSYEISFNFTKKVYSSKEFLEIMNIFEIGNESEIDQSLMLFHKSEILQMYSLFDDALECIETALSLSPNNNSLFLQKAKILKFNEKYYEALKVLNDLIELYPEHAQAYEWRASIYRYPLFNAGLYKENQMKVKELSLGQCRTLPDWSGP
ncbi:MAG TPA: hypothetical protein PKN32_05505 [Bacteroidales bacterium]|nr:hypothetical protein [Bacteroidales bacterium]